MIRKVLLPCALAIALAPAWAQDVGPTQIFLAPFSESEGKTIRIVFLVIDKADMRIGKPVVKVVADARDDGPLVFLPDSTGLLFGSTRNGAPSDILKYDIASRKVAPMTPTPEKAPAPMAARPTCEGTPDLDKGEQAACTPDGTFVIGRKSKLFYWEAETDRWIEFADVGKAGGRNITRVAFSPDGKWIAIAASADQRR